MNSLKEKIIKNISNIPGWRTSRNILVIESDDWGSVRIKDKSAYQALKNKGLNMDRIHYDSVESLESNKDLEMLFDLLQSFKDKNGNHPVFTPMCIMGNPDFEKIKESDYQQYFFQPLHETLKEFSQSDRVLELWKKGFEQNIFVPEIHGREHINVRRYMKILQSHEGKQGLRYALDYHSVGPSEYNGIRYPNYLGALHPEAKDEISELHQHILEAGKLFRQYIGYHPRVFIAPNAEEPKELEYSLKQIGVQYLTRSKNRVYPLGDGQFAKEWNFIGSKNVFDQVIINRNSFFEPVCFGEQENISDWVASCLKEIEIAFRWKKPAVISSHRVNYVGSIRPENREKGLNELRRLLISILKIWPNVEFLSSFELGKIIKEDLEK
ncbi:MAG: polysaccharide (de)acetylase [Flavobacterium psychrophilum]